MVNFDNIQKLHRRDVLHDRFHAQRFIDDDANRLHNLIYVSRNIINNRLLVIQYLTHSGRIIFDYRG